MEIPRNLLLCLVFIGSGASVEACDDGWIPYHNSCYWFSSGPDVVFRDAVVKCSDKGSTLLEIKHLVEEKWLLLQSLIRQYNQMWVGLTDVVDEGRYVLVSNGLRPQYTNWDQGQPNGGRGENCAVLQTTSRKWHDYPCSAKKSYVCYKPAV